MAQRGAQESQAPSRGPRRGLALGSQAAAWAAGRGVSSGPLAATPVGPAISCSVISPRTSWPEPALVRMHSSAVIPSPWGFSVDVDGVRTPGDLRVTPTQKQVPALLPASQSLPQRLRVAPRQPAPQPLWAQAQVSVQGEQTSVKEALTQSQKEGEYPEELGGAGSTQVSLRMPAPACPRGVWMGPSPVCLLLL